ncbi:MAG TPA: substrate-binding domain-containing protein [Roseiflexaceae bacterium]|nr:substrate-binding domain-containing protein [Roseiflexaceae bacterium]
MVQTRSTLGFISTWPIYQGTTIDRHAYALIQGIRAAAHEHACHLLVGGGVSVSTDHTAWRTHWPAPGPNTDFIPIGPWNTDGLIIVPDDLSQTQAAYIRDLQAAGFPVLFTTLEGRGPVVTVDNSSGIRQAMAHLYEHGHRRIAFIAGKARRGGDSAERLQAYRAALHDHGLSLEPCLIAHGEHRYDGGHAAMHQILQSGVPFTAFIASNDLSCLGAIDTLTRAGLRVPADIAAIGFDDILDARSHTPSLTTVRHPTFVLGYQAVTTLLDLIAGRQVVGSRVVVPTRLIIRQSCGCTPERFGPLAAAPHMPAASSEPPDPLVRRMAEAAFTEARHTPIDELEDQCRNVVQALQASIHTTSADPLHHAIDRMREQIRLHREDTHVWQAALSALYRRSELWIEHVAAERRRWILGLLDQIRQEMSEQVQRENTQALLKHMDMMSQLGLLTSQLLAALDISQSTAILTAYLPRLGIDHALVAIYCGDEEDSVAQSEVLLSIGMPHYEAGRRFASRSFPLPGENPAEQPLQWLILPLSIDNHMTGFVAFSATNIEPAATIVQNLATAIHASQLYREALEGRRMAEEANRLKSRFLSMVSHELRTPLSLVVGLSEMVLREYRDTGGLAAGSDQDLEHILTSARHLGHLIGDVLDLANSEAGQLRLVQQPLNLADLLLAVGRTGEQLAREKGLAWQIRIAAPGPWVLADTTRLQQVVLNLISNAVKFTDSGHVALEMHPGDSWVTVTISDTGIGIAADEQALIFSEFYRSEHAIRHTSGLGLGLAICHHLVKLHGGTMGVESPGNTGRGSTFRFSLPTIAPPVPIDIPADEALCIVLLAEQSGQSDWLEQQLTARGFEIRRQLVDQGTGWITPLLAAPPAAVVLDHELAGHRGWEIIGHFKRQPELDLLPVLVCRLDPTHNQGELIELNYLLKPLQIDRLAHELMRQGITTTEAAPRRTILIVDDDRTS